ncbi:PQQ-binding-like beta-propeller repeat protein [Saccharopolyspora sp. NPDC000359]|uniref:outer membrane protein assembly factor BamB family protein n=1 Tax=Saccharopolyspora sp. NPDC000359 TaxID=3154251 RepID=UPI00332A108E
MAGRFWSAAVVLAAVLGATACSGGGAPAAPEAAPPALPGAPVPGLAAQPVWQGALAARGHGDFGTSVFQKVASTGEVFAFLGDQGQQEVLTFVDPASGRERASIPVPSGESKAAEVTSGDVGGRPVVVLRYPTTTPGTTTTAAREEAVTEVYDSAAQLVWRQAGEPDSPEQFRNGWLVRSEPGSGVQVVHDLGGTEVWRSGDLTIAGAQHVVEVRGDVLITQYGDSGPLVAYRLSPAGSAQLWQSSDVAPPGEGGPAVAPDVVGFAEGQVLIHWQLDADFYALAAHDPASGAVAWSVPVERGHRWSGFQQDLTYDPVSGVAAVHSESGATVVDVRGGRLLWENSDEDRAFQVTAVTARAVYGLVDGELPIAMATEQKQLVGEGLTALPIATAGGYAWATRGPAEHWVFAVE